MSDADEITALRAQLAEANERAKTAERTMRKRDEKTFGEAVSRLRLAWNERDAARAQLETARGLLAGAERDRREWFDRSRRNGNSLSDARAALDVAVRCLNRLRSEYGGTNVQAIVDVALSDIASAPVQHAAPVASDVREETLREVMAALREELRAPSNTPDGRSFGMGMLDWLGDLLVKGPTPAPVASDGEGPCPICGAPGDGYGCDCNYGPPTAAPTPDAAGTAVPVKRCRHHVPLCWDCENGDGDEDHAASPPEALPREPQAARRDPDLLAIYEDLDARGRLIEAGKETLHQLRSAPESTPPREPSRMGDAEWTCPVCGCWRILDVAAMTEADKQGPTYLCDNHGCACWEHQSTPPKEKP